MCTLSRQVQVDDAGKAARHCRQHPDSHSTMQILVVQMPLKLLRRLVCSCNLAIQPGALLLPAPPSNEPKLMPPVTARESQPEVTTKYCLCQVLQRAAQQAYQSGIQQPSLSHKIQQQSIARCIAYIRPPPAPMNAILVSDVEVAMHLAPFAAGLPIALAAITRGCRAPSRLAARRLCILLIWSDHLQHYGLCELAMRVSEVRSMWATAPYQALLVTGFD